ncbi:MAG TPA: peptidogalycan biosysnthesis protein, partial [Gammaproteobacteria bacterium]
MTLRFVDSLADVPAADWDRLAGDDPFLSHAFLAALERHDCLLPFGWQPQHATLWDAGGRLRGAVPFYLKQNSYGEFVFDWDWAEAYQRAGLAYYPKGVVGIPYTPATGARILLAERDDEQAAALLVDAVHRRAAELGLSSVHWNFLDGRDAQRLEQAGLLPRRGCQYHWEHRGERDFDQLLAGFTSAKRKKIRHERRVVADSGITIEQRCGRTATAADWDAFHALYLELFERKWGMPTLSREFFAAVGAGLGERVLLLLAREGDETLAAALSLRSD